MIAVCSLMRSALWSGWCCTPLTACRPSQPLWRHDSGCVYQALQTFKRSACNRLHDGQVGSVVNWPPSQRPGHYRGIGSPVGEGGEAEEGAHLGVQHALVHHRVLSRVIHHWNTRFVTKHLHRHPCRNQPDLVHMCSLQSLDRLWKLSKKLHSSAKRARICCTTHGDQPLRNACGRSRKLWLA